MALYGASRFIVFNAQTKSLYMLMHINSKLVLQKGISEFAEMPVLEKGGQTMILDENILYTLYDQMIKLVTAPKRGLTKYSTLVSPNSALRKEEIRYA